MCKVCGVIKSIDYYLAKADDDLADELEDEGRAIPEDSTKMVSEMEDELAAVLTKQTAYFVSQLKKKKTVAEVMDVIDEIKAADVCGEEVKAVALEQLKKYIPKMVVDYASVTDSGIKITALSKRTTAWIEDWSEELGEIMKLTSHTELENILKTSLENGDSITAVAKIIQDSGIRDEYYRARQTAMTEMFRAHNVSRYEAALQSPCIVGRRWRHSGVGTPRPNHLEMDGQTVDKDKPFTLNGADGSVYYPMYPVDPILPPSEAVSCHCTCDDIVDENILGLSVEERQQLRDEALKELDDDWEKDVDEKYRALVGLSTDN
jgi:hypothetical protein